MSNLDVYNSFCRPPETALKRIQFGHLKGKSDINPQWRIRAMTEQFGPCGIGWKYSIDKLWIEDGANGERIGFAQISLFIKVDDVWSDAIPGLGGNDFIAKNKNGLQNNDEVYKMAITDALSVAMKCLGVAGDIYSGMHDGSKYTRTEQPQQPAPKPDPLTEWKKLVVKKCNSCQTAEALTSYLAEIDQDIMRMPPKDQESFKAKVTDPLYAKFEGATNGNS